MSEITCYESVVDQEGRPAWRRMDCVPWLSAHNGTLVLDAPVVALTVNGLDVIGGLQVIEPNDWVRSAEISFLVGRQVAQIEPSKGCICAATGRRIHEEYAVRCTTCRTLYAQSAAEQMGKCLMCGVPLHVTEELPPEKLL